jgi:hypothetical protein
MVRTYWILKSNITDEYLEHIPLYRKPLRWTYDKKKAFEFESFEEAEQFTHKFVMGREDEQTLDMDYEEITETKAERAERVKTMSFYLIRNRNANAYLKEFISSTQTVETWTLQIRQAKRFHYIETARIAVEMVKTVSNGLALIECDYQYRVLNEITADSIMSNKKDFRARMEYAAGGLCEMLWRGMTEEEATTRLFAEYRKGGKIISQGSLVILTARQLPGTTPITERSMIGPSL